jgi:hypothetical protein
MAARAGSKAAAHERPAKVSSFVDPIHGKLPNSPLRTPRIGDPPPEAPCPTEYWEALLGGPRAAGRPWLPIQQRRLSEIPRELLRVQCGRCSRCVEIQRFLEDPAPNREPPSGEMNRAGACRPATSCVGATQ